MKRHLRDLLHDLAEEVAPVSEMTPRLARRLRWRQARVAAASVFALAVLASGTTYAVQALRTAVSNRPVSGPAKCSKGWHVVRGPSLPGDRQERLFSLGAASAVDAWAVGERWAPYQTSPEVRLGPYPLIEHWDGRKWTIVPAQDPHHWNASLFAVAVLGADNAWAVGGFRSFGRTPGESPLVQHWDGRKWTAITVPRLAQGASASQELIGLAASSPDDVWVLGHSSANGATFLNRLLHWDGRSWSLVPSRQSHATYGVSLLMDVVVDRAGRAWAVGGRLHGIGEASTFNGALVETWNGNSWRPAQAPDGALPLTAVATTGRTLWAIRRPFLSGSPESYLVGGGPGMMSVMKSTSAGWVTALSTEGALNDVAVADNRSAWVVGARRGRPLVLHWDGASWTMITAGAARQIARGIVGRDSSGQQGRPRSRRQRPQAWKSKCTLDALRLTLDRPKDAIWNLYTHQRMALGADSKLFESEYVFLPM
jgi:hypothetical protein